MNEADKTELQAIRKKLQALQRSPSEAAAPMSADWSLSSERPSSFAAETPEGWEPGDRGIDASNVVTTLQLRFPRGSQEMPKSGASRLPVDPDPPFPPAALQPYLQTLETQVQRINRLAQDQQAAILTFQQMVKQAEQALQRYGEDRGNPTLVKQLCPQEPATITWIQSGEDVYTYSLISHQLDWHQAEREAYDNARMLRKRRSTRRKRTPLQGTDAASGVEMLLAEPLAILQGLGQGLGRSLQVLGMSLSGPRSSRGSRATLSPLDALIWFTGAVIARKLMGWIIGTYPFLWPLTIAVIVILVVVALYQVTRRYRPDFGLASRLIVAMLGLIIGGRL